MFPTAAKDRFPVFRGRHMLVRKWKELFRTISPAGPFLWPHGKGKKTPTGPLLSLFESPIGHRRKNQFSPTT
jgi:hypothetical protein